LFYYPILTHLYTHCSVEEESLCAIVPPQVSEGEEIQAEHSFSALLTPVVHASWLLDSCCSQHMSGNENLFISMRDTNTNTFVKFGDGKKLQAKGYGAVATPIGTLDALYVPNLCVNLMSVSQLNSIGASVSFLPNMSEIRLNGQRFGVSVIGNIFQVDEVCNFSSHENEIYLWHQKLGHLNFPAVISFLKRFGIKYELPKNLFCRICAEAKLSEQKFRNRDDKLTVILGRLHSDMGGPIDPSYDGFIYWIIFIDEASRYCKVYFLKRKSEAVQAVLEICRQLQKSSGCGISIFRSDGGGEYQSLKVQEFFKAEGIQHEISPPYTPQLNGMAERLNRTLMEIVRCLLICAGLAHSFWRHAMEYAVYIYNHTPHSGIEFRTPSEVFYGKSLSKLPKFHVFGSISYYHVPKQLRSKLDGTGQRCIFLGFTSTCTLVLSLPDLMIREVRTVKINDGEFLSAEESRELGMEQRIREERSEPIMNSVEEVQRSLTQLNEKQVNAESFPVPSVNRNSDDYKGVQMEDQENGEGVRRLRARKPISYVEEEEEWHPSLGRRHLQSANNDSDWKIEEEETNLVTHFDYLSLLNLNDDTLYAMLSQVTQQIEKLGQVTQDKDNSSEFKDNSSELSYSSIHLSEPNSFEEAFKDPKWLKSMEQEIKSLLDNETWILTDLPKGRKPVRNKWVYRVKNDGRLKSRLVAKGFTQVFGIDFDETWSPVGRKASLKLLISFVIGNSWKWKQMDVDTAFLNSKLDEEIYMDQPKGFEDGSERVCHLLKSIYGLKQASRMWYNTLKDFLESAGLTRSRIDPCIYLAPGLIIFVYVDDIVIAAESDKKLRHISDQFKKRFMMKDMGKPTHILGLDIMELSNGEGIHLSGKKMISELLENCKMDGSRHVSTPMDPNQSFVPNPSVSNGSSKIGLFNYGSVIGSLIYIANSFRPDIAYAVSVLSQFTTNPSEDHFRGVKRVLRYLNGTRDYGLLYKSKSKGLHLYGYTDADFASCFSRRSRSGFIFYSGNSTLSWSSKKATDDCFINM
jgi:hypothetical protein